MRATGKTFRVALRAVADASDGKFVIVVSKHRYDHHVKQYIAAAIAPVEGWVTFRHSSNEFRFVPPLVGSIRLTDIDAFTRDVREHRYDGLEKYRLKVGFDDCGPDEYTTLFLLERARG